MPLLSLCYGLSNNANDQKKLKDILDTSSSGAEQLVITAEASVRPPFLRLTGLSLRVFQFACQGMLWKLGDFALKDAKHELASDWYLSSTHPIFGALSESNFPKARRKAALALLHAKDFIRAEQIMQVALAGGASDHYLLFLAAVGENNEPKGERNFGRDVKAILMISLIAIRAVKALVKSSDFQMDMLLWAAKQAKECELPGLFKYCLQSILDSSEKGASAGQGVDNLTILRYGVLTKLGAYNSERSLPADAYSKLLWRSMRKRMPTRNKRVHCKLYRNSWNSRSDCC